MIKYFKPEMFLNQFTQNLRQIDLNDAAEITNEELQKLIDANPVVYGTLRSGKFFNFSEGEKLQKPFEARLMFIEPIVKAECKHERLEYGYKHSAPWAKCKDCNAELVAKWEPVK